MPASFLSLFSIYLLWNTIYYVTTAETERVERTVENGGGRVQEVNVRTLTSD